MHGRYRLVRGLVGRRDLLRYLAGGIEPLQLYPNHPSSLPTLNRSDYTRLIAILILRLGAHT